MNKQKMNNLLAHPSVLMMFLPLCLQYHLSHVLEHTPKVMEVLMLSQQVE